MLHHSRIGVNGTKAQRPNGATVQQRIGVIEKGETGRGGDWGTKRLRDGGTTRLHVSCPEIGLHKM